jgi:microcystin-dependent protein
MDPFIAEIRVFGFNFAPKGWAECSGQLMPVSQNIALFSLLETNFGGDGKSTFALPNLNAKAPVGQGQGQGLAPYEVGDEGGALTVALKSPETAHTHQAQATSEPANVQAPGPDRVLARSTPGYAYQGNVSPPDLVKMNAQSTTFAGVPDTAHSNISPCTVLKFCIALQGTFPPRG